MSCEFAAKSGKLPLNRSMPHAFRTPANGDRPNAKRPAAPLRGPSKRAVAPSEACAFPFRGRSSALSERKTSMANRESGHEWLARRLREAVDEYVEHGAADNATEINCGSCADVAEILTSRPDCPAGAVTGDTGSLFVDDGAVWPKSTHVPGLGGLRELREVANFDDLGHTFILYDGRAYDAEHPAGVEHPIELSCIRRALVETLEEKRPETAIRLISREPWWTESKRLDDDFQAWFYGTSPTPGQISGPSPIGH